MAALALLVTGCSSDGDDDPPAADPPSDKRDAWIDRQLSNMTLEQKVGQLFIGFAYGETADTTDDDAVRSNREAHGVDNAAELVGAYHLGGIAYFTWSDNLADPQQIAELSNGVQQAALNSGQPVPLLIGTDQEYGAIVRVGSPVAQFPGAMALGATGSTTDAHSAAAIAGRELRALGINQNYAPVADVNVNPANPVIGTRSPGSDPQLVADVAAAEVAGFQSGPDGVSATAKHFPGHGDTDVDSHTGLPEITHSLEEWRRIDAPPFRAAIDSGVDAIMTGHIRFPALDDTGTPATLSQPILTGMLREELGFDGVIITDSLDMGGVSNDYSAEEIPVMALQAGADILLTPPNIDVAYDAVLSAVDGGELTEQRIDESVRRILALKYDRGIVDEPMTDPAMIEQTVGIDEHLTGAAEVAAHSTTMLANDAGTLPVAEDVRNVLVTGWGEDTTATLAERIADRGPDTEVVPTGAEPDNEVINAAAGTATTVDLTVVTTKDVGADPAQAELVRRLRLTGTPVVVIAVDTPYDIAQLDQVDTYLATYSTAETALEAAVAVAFDGAEPQGTLPVTIPLADDPQTPLYDVGAGLKY